MFIKKASYMANIDNVLFWLLITCSLLTTLLFSPWSNDIFAVPKVAVLLLVAACIAGFLSLRQLTHNWPTKINWRPMLPILLFFVLSAASFLNSVDSKISFNGTYNQREGILIFLAYGVLFFAAASIDWDSGRVERYSRTLVDVATAIAAYGILQYFGIDFIPWPRGGFELWRSFSTLGNPDFLAVYLVTILPLALFFTLSKKFHRYRPTFLNILQLIIISLAIITSFTRGAWLITVIIFLVVYLFARRRTNLPGLPLYAGLIAIAGLMLITTVALSGRGLWPRLLSVLSWRALTESGRIDLWWSALKMAGVRPLLGWGPDTFALISPHYFTDRLAGLQAIANSPHNYVLHLAATLGITASIMFFAFLIVVMIKAFKIRDQSNQDLWPALGLAIAAFIAISMVEPVQPGEVFLIWIFSGMILSTQIQRGGEDRPRPHASSLTIRVMAAIVIAAFVPILIYGAVTATLGDYYFLQANISNNYYDAVGNYQSAIDTAPGMVIYHFRKCRAVRKKAEFEKSKNAFDAALACTRGAESEHPLEADFYIEEARVLLQVGKYVDNSYFKELDRPLKALKRLRPKSLAGYYLRAAASFSQGDIKTAKKELRRALALRPDGFGMPEELMELIKEINKTR